jgi:hypothetical protein
MSVKHTAQGLAGLGRYGDSTLVHMQPHEVEGLQAIARAQGTTLTTNPDTGLPEAFNMGNFFRSMAPTLAGAGMMMIPGGQVAGLSAMQAGIAAGALTGAALNKDDPLLGAVMGGFGGYGGANLAGSALGSGTQGAFEHSMGLNKAYSAGAGTMAPTTAAPNVIANGNIAPNMGQVNPVNNAANFQSDMGLNRAFQAGDSNFANLSEANNPSALGNLNQAYQNVSSDPMEFVSKNKFGLGMPLAMGALSGMSPENNLIPKTDVYDPYATLNLGGSSSEGESGLRLLAAGGPVSFAEGGSMEGGGAGAMQGAGPMRVSVSSSGANQPAGAGIPVNFGLFADQAMIDAARAERLNMMRQPTRGLTGVTGMSGRNGVNGIGMLGSVSGFSRNRMAEDQGNVGSLNLNTQDPMRLANGGSIQAGGLQDLYGTRDDSMTGPTLSRDGYGMGRLNTLAAGGMAGYAKGGYLDGPGDGMSDSIPATIEGKQPARLADGEFVVPADVVSHLGNGSTKAGSKRLYDMLDKVRKARTGNKKQGKQINPNKFMPA